MKLSKLIESLKPTLRAKAQKGARRLLLTLEEEGTIGPDMDVEVPEPADDAGEPEDKLWAGFLDACEAILKKYKAGEMTAQEASREVASYLKTHERLCAGKAPEPAPEPDESDEVVKTEQRRRRASARVIESGGIPEWVAEEVVRTTPEWPETGREIPEWGNDLPRTSIWGDAPAWR